MAQTDSETLSLIEGLLKEQRTFPPTEEFRRSAIIQDDAVYREAEEDFEALGTARRRVHRVVPQAGRSASSGLRRTAPGSRTGS